MSEDTKYATIKHTWADIWEDKDVEVAYRFAKPTPIMIKRMQTTASKDTSLAAQRLLKDVVHSEDADKLTHDIESYPFLSTTLANSIMKACGFADLGN